ncbi:MAG TPA: hypothetical protein VG890_18160 [Puia sp.]|nr:hypothetical protein [Puia sp.]
MKTGLRFLCFALVCSFVQAGEVKAQDITGIWRGHFRSNDGFERLTGYDDRYKIEVQIAQTNRLFQAVTYSYKNTEFYGKAAAEGTVNPATKKVLLRELKILEVRMSGGDVCIMTCFLQYSKLGDDEYLQGTYTSASTHDSLAGCGKGIIFLHKVTTTDFQKEPFLEKKEAELAAAARKKALPAGSATKKPPAVAVKPPAVTRPAQPSGKTKTPAPVAKAKTAPAHKPDNKPSPPVEKKSVTAVPEQRHAVGGDSAMQIDNKPLPMILPKVLTNRSNEVIKTFTVNNPEVQLNIYDDGAIDNDTISVYYDNKLVISRARISDQPLKLTIQVDPSDHPHELVMVAENLGDIPPNTSLMVVRDGDKRYEVRIVSTEQKNAVITFRYQKIE